MTHQIAILATGTELIQGDILNTNAQHIAHQLVEQHYSVGMHMMVSDAQPQIVQALQYLLTLHDVVLVIGGLGPTSDDRTRFALAEVIQKPLMFHAPSWDYIVQRLSHYNVKITDNNRQQAMFPESASILWNENGTANGCKAIYTSSQITNPKIIYLMPGPPHECLPLFRNTIYPDLQQYFTPKPRFKKKWRLFNVSESDIAEQLESVLRNFDVVTGYRIDYPYLEFKIETEANHEPILAALLPLIKTRFLCDEYRTASELLRERLALINYQVLIIDEVTGGQLQLAVTSKENYHAIFFTDNPKIDFAARITLTGLTEYWQGNEQAKTTQLKIQFKQGETCIIVVKEIPYRPVRVIKFAVELACKEILEFLLGCDSHKT